MNRNLTVLFCLTIFTKSLWSQPIGYLGKTLNIGYAIDGMPGTGAVFQNDNFLDFNFKHSLVIEWAAMKEMAMGFSYQQINDIIQFAKYTVSSELPNTPNNEFSGGVKKYYSNANFYGNSKNYYLKFFLFEGAGAIAPFGRYIILKYTSSVVEITDDGRYYASGKRDLKEVKMNYYMIGFGTQKIYFDRLIIDLGFQTGIPTTFFKDLNDPKKDEITKTSDYKMISDQLVNMHVGISILLF